MIEYVGGRDNVSEMRYRREVFGLTEAQLSGLPERSLERAMVRDRVTVDPTMELYGNQEEYIERTQVPSQPNKVVLHIWNKRVRANVVCVDLSEEEIDVVLGSLHITDDSRVEQE
jgi:hypothetical protein